LKNPSQDVNKLAGLEKVALEEDQITERVETCYEKERVESPGVESKDFVLTILSPIQDSKKDY
jgi:hypothetical protein